MTKLLERHDVFNKKRTFGFFEDFFSYDKSATAASALVIDSLTADSSSAATLVLCKATTGAEGGVLSVTQDATDNDELYFFSTQALFKFANNKPAIFECKLQYSEGATNANNVMVGFVSSKAANTIIDDGGGPVANATMAVIYKLDGGTVWRCRSQVGAAVGQTDSVSASTAGGSSYQTLTIEFIPYSATNAYINYYLDNELLKDANGRVIQHDLVYTNAVNCYAFVGFKTGSATAEAQLVDYMAAYQLR